jgi:hypothetical protein
MYLSWTGDVPAMYLPYTRASDAPDHEARDVRSWLL